MDNLIIRWIALVFLIGGFYAEMKIRMSRIEKVLGIGRNSEENGVFIRRREVDILKKQADEDHIRYEENLKEIFTRINEIEKILSRLESKRKRG